MAAYPIVDIIDVLTHQRVDLFLFRVSGISSCMGSQWNWTELLLVVVVVGEGSFSYHCLIPRPTFMRGNLFSYKTVEDIAAWISLVHHHQHEM